MTLEKIDRLRLLCDKAHKQYNNNQKNAQAIKINKLTMQVTKPHRTLKISCK